MAYTSTSEIRTLIRGTIKDLINDTGRNSHVYDSDSSFKLSKNRVSSSTIIVYVNGTDITSSNWSYNPDTNKVTISSSLTADDDVMITFSYFNKYSDSELNSYINSNLTHFVRYKYPKQFYMDSNDNVVVDNGEYPTEAEGRIIALVTSIDINPQNIDKSTRDFKISATEKLSKSDLIKFAIKDFTKGSFSLSFIETEIE